jgi:hypothetical protein
MRLYRIAGFIIAATLTFLFGAPAKSQDSAKSTDDPRIYTNSGGSPALNSPEQSRGRSKSIFETG